MRIFLPVHAKNPNLVLATEYPSLDFLDDLSDKNWTDLSKPGNHEDNPVERYSIQVPYSLYERVRGVIRGTVNGLKNAQSSLQWYQNKIQNVPANQLSSGHQKQIDYYQGIIDSYKKYNMDNFLAQQEFWERVDEETIVQEINFNPYKLTAHVEKLHRLKEYGPKRISPCR